MKMKIAMHFVPTARLSKRIIVFKYEESKKLANKAKKKRGGKKIKKQSGKSSRIAYCTFFIN